MLSPWMDSVFESNIDEREGEEGTVFVCWAIRFLAAAFLKRYYELNEFYETNCIH